MTAVTGLTDRINLPVQRRCSGGDQSPLPPGFLIFNLRGRFMRSPARTHAASVADTSCMAVVDSVKCFARSFFSLQLSRLFPAIVYRLTMSPKLELFCSCRIHGEFMVALTLWLSGSRMFCSKNRISICDTNTFNI